MNGGSRCQKICVRLTAENAESAEFLRKNADSQLGASLAIVRRMATEAERLNSLTERIIGAAIEVHKALGPGLLESAYEACLYYELVKRGLKVERQKPLPLTYDGVQLDCAYRMDLVIEGAVVIEIKSIERLERVHEAQMISYLKLSKLKIGLILNFNVRNLVRDGLWRRVNDFPE